MNAPKIRAFHSAHCPSRKWCLSGLHSDNLWLALMSAWSANTSKHSETPLVELCAIFLLFSAVILIVDISTGRFLVTRRCTIPPRHEKGCYTSQQPIIKQCRAAYVTSWDSCVFFNRDFVGILLAKRCWTLGTKVSRLHQGITISKKSITKGIQGKRRPSANIRLAGSQLSAGYSNETNTRSATPRALTRSCVNTGTTKIN